MHETTRRTRFLVGTVCRSWRLRPASLHHGDPTAVGVGDVVETKKLPWTPTNKRASDLIDHGLDLDVACREHRSNKKEESVAAFLGLEVSGGPRNEFDQWGGRWLTVDHENAFCGEDYSPGYHTPEEWRADWSVGHVA